MTVVYRLSSGRYPANSGEGAALYGGRWNPKGTGVIYTAQSPSLAVLEVLVHYDVLPRDFVLTTIQIPDNLNVLVLADENLPANWDCETPISATQDLGERWVREGRYGVLSVPSSIVSMERNLILNTTHPDFADIGFLPSMPFRFNSRFKKKDERVLKQPLS